MRCSRRLFWSRMGRRMGGAWLLCVWMACSGGSSSELDCPAGARVKGSKAGGMALYCEEKGVKQGPWIYWTTKENKGQETRYVDGKRAGTWREWDRQGRLLVQGAYLADQRAGLWEEWYESGKRRSSCFYVADIKQGGCTRWYESGQIDAVETFVDGERISGHGNPDYTGGCAKGRMEDCMYLGRMYREGSGVEQDYARARAEYGKACEGGWVDACADLAFMIVRGEGAEPDLEGARRMMKEGCERGSKFACLKLENGDLESWVGSR